MEFYIGLEMGTKGHRHNRKLQEPKYNSYAILGEGDTERYYVKVLRERLGRNCKIRLIYIPELTTNLSLKEQYKRLTELLSEGEYDKIFWILDADRYIHDKKLVDLIEFIIKAEKKNIVVIVNNPCIEFWFLLHYQLTTRFERNCENILSLLQKKYLPEYRKGNEKGLLKLYEYLSDAIVHAKHGFTGYTEAENFNQGFSTMYLLVCDEKIRACLGLADCGN